MDIIDLTTPCVRKRYTPWNVLLDLGRNSGEQLKQVGATLPLTHLSHAWVTTTINGCCYNSSMYPLRYDCGYGNCMLTLGSRLGNLATKPPAAPPTHTWSPHLRVVRLWTDKYAKWVAVRVAAHGREDWWAPGEPGPLMAQSVSPPNLTKPEPRAESVTNRVHTRIFILCSVLPRGMYACTMLCWCLEQEMQCCFGWPCALLLANAIGDRWRRWALS